MRSVLKLLTLTAVAVAALTALARPASAVGSISIDEGTSFRASQVITVRYKGYPLYQRLFVQQCWDDPADPNFDFSVSCSVSNMLTPSLVDRDEGTYKFKLFVGDEPSGLFGASCGPKFDPDNIAHATCWIRSVMTARDRNDLSAWVAITFEGAEPAPATTTPPRTTIAEAAAGDSTVATAPPTTTAPSAPSSPKVTVVPHSPEHRNVLPYVIGGVSAVTVLTVLVRRSTRRRPTRTAPASTVRAEADARQPALVTDE